LVIESLRGSVVESLQGSEDWSICACSHCLEELPGFDHCDGFVFQVLVTGGGFLDYSLHHIWRHFQSFEEVVHCLPAPYCVACLPNQCFEVADVLVDKWELEVVSVKGCLSSFLPSGVCELGLEAVEEVGVGVFDVVSDGVELLYRLEHHFYPSIDLQSFDECKSNGDTPDWGLKAWDSLVCHHV
jgi:hypothetical protein